MRKLSDGPKRRRHDRNGVSNTYAPRHEHGSITRIACHVDRLSMRQARMLSTVAAEANGSRHALSDRQFFHLARAVRVPVVLFALLLLALALIDLGSVLVGQTI